MESKQLDYAEMIKTEFLNVAYAMQRPSVLYRPSLSIDGDQWCVLYGKDLQSGVAGFGESPAKAMEDFDKVWYDFKSNHKQSKVL